MRKSSPRKGALCTYLLRIGRRYDPGRAVQTNLAIGCSKREKSTFYGFENDRKVLDAYLAHETSHRANLRRRFGRGARGRAEEDRGVEALYMHRAIACV